MPLPMLFRGFINFPKRQNNEHSNREHKYYFGRVAAGVEVVVGVGVEVVVEVEVGVGLMTPDNRAEKIYYIAKHESESGDRNYI